VQGCRCINETSQWSGVEANATASRQAAGNEAREVKMGREGEEEGITRAVALGFRHRGPACFLCRGGGGGGRVSKCTIYKHN